MTADGPTADHKYRFSFCKHKWKNHKLSLKTSSGVTVTDVEMWTWTALTCNLDAWNWTFKFGNKHVMFHVLTVGFTASDDVMCWSGLILCTQMWLIYMWMIMEKGSEEYLSDEHLSRFLYYWRTIWNNCQPISSLWCTETYFRNKKRCTVTSVYRTVVLESGIILHSEIEQRTGVSSLELGAGGLK